MLNNRLKILFLAAAIAVPLAASGAITTEAKTRRGEHHRAEQATRLVHAPIARDRRHARFHHRKARHYRRHIRHWHHWRHHRHYHRWHRHHQYRRLPRIIFYY